MKTYKRLFSALMLLTVFILGFASCSDDDISSEERWVNFVTVNKVSEGTYDFTLDNGDKLWIEQPKDLVLNPKYERAIINYTILSGQNEGYSHNIKLNGFQDILTKDPIYIPADNQFKQDSIGHDPIRVEAIWEGGGYLNIRFAYNTGETKTHMVNLVSADPTLSVADDVVKLEFRHNKYNDPEKYPVQGYVSFDLSPYRIAGRNKVNFEISAKDFGAEGKVQVYTIEYNYTEPQ